MSAANGSGRSPKGDHRQLDQNKLLAGHNVVFIYFPVLPGEKPIGRLWADCIVHINTCIRGRENTIKLQVMRSQKKTLKKDQNKEGSNNETGTVIPIL